MKTKSFIAGLLIIASALSHAATNDLTSALQRGLFEEEANRNLDAAAQAYQSVSTQFDKDRALAATAIFRLGEIYRKQNKTNEAAAQYERIVREFADQNTLVTLSRQNLAGLSSGTIAKPQTATTVAATPLSQNSRAQLRQLLEEEIGLVEQKLGSQRGRVSSGTVTQADILSTQQELLALKRQLVTISDEDAAAVDASESRTGTDEEEAEIRRIQIMIKDSPDLINAKDAAAGATPLHNAAARGQLTVARFLLANGADVEARDRQWGGRTPLQYAAGAGNKAMVELLLSQKADVNSADNTGNTALHLAVLNGFRSVVEVLVMGGGANVNAQRKTGVTPLHLAVVNGYRNMAEALLKWKANPNVNSTELIVPVGVNQSFRGTPLHIAVGRRDQALIELLLNYQADVNSHDDQGNTPLHSAVLTDSTNVVALLLAKGAGVNITNQQGTAPLLIAIERQQSSIARLLLEHKANPDAPGIFTRREPGGMMTSSCNYPLRAAVQLQSLDLLTLLLEHGADPNTAGKCQGGALGPPLWVAVTNPNEDAVKLLLQFKANPNSERLDFKPLIEATARGSQGIVELLLKAGADPKAATSNGRTALHAAVVSRDSVIVQLLLAGGADPNMRNSDGQTPLDLAKQTRAPRQPEGTIPQTQPTDVVALLRQHGALDDLPRLDRIEVRRASANYSATAFEFGTNKWNQFTLLEVIAWQYGFISTERNATWVMNQSTKPSSFWGKTPCPFPDLDRVIIRRSEPGKARWTETVVNVAAALESGDCARDVILQPGDIVEIPEMDHPVNEKWAGLAEVQVSNLLHCVSRRVTISVKGTANSIQLSPKLAVTNVLEPYGERMKELTKGSFMLKSVLAQSRLLRAASDLSRVKITRRANGKAQEWVMDCSSGHDPDFWLRDGDVIEVPDKL